MIFWDNQLFDGPFSKRLCFFIGWTGIGLFALFVLQNQIERFLDFLLIFADLFVLRRLFWFFLLFHFNLVNLFELFGLTKISEGPLSNDDSFLQNDDLISILWEFRCMSRENDGLPLKVSQNSFFYDELGHVNIHCTDDIIKQQNISLGVNRSGKRYSSFLTTRQINSLFSNLSKLPLH